MWNWFWGTSNDETGGDHNPVHQSDDSSDENVLPPSDPVIECLSKTQTYLAEDMLAEAVKSYSEFSKLVSQQQTSINPEEKKTRMECLLSCESKLKKKIDEAVNQSIKKQDIKELENLSSYYCTLGSKVKGLLIYKNNCLGPEIENKCSLVFKYLNNYLLAKQKQKENSITSDEMYDSLIDILDEKGETKNRLSFGDTFDKLFQQAILFLNTKEKFILNNFGVDGLKFALEVMTLAIDNHMDYFFEEFFKFFQLKEIMKTLKNEEIPTNENLNEILTEIVYINQCNISFQKYLNEKTLKQLEGNQNLQTTTEKKGKISQKYKRDKWIKEILEFYGKIEENFMKEAVKKALSIGQIIKEDSFVSNMIDNVFFIFKRSYQRAFETGNLEISLRICQTIVQLIEHNLKKEIRKMINDFFDNDESKIDLLVVLNDISTTNDYLNQLSQEMNFEAKIIFKHSEKEFKNIETYFNLIQKQTEDFQKVLKDYLKKILEIRQYQLSSIISDSLSVISYSINADQFQEREVNNPLISRLTKNLQDFLSKYKTKLTKNNYIEFIHILLDVIKKPLEENYSKKKFTLFGALQMQNEISFLGNFFSSESYGTNMRGHFSKLVEIATVLNVEIPKDCFALLNHQSIKWQLDESQVKNWLLKRVEFDSREIKMLKLPEKRLK